MLNSGCTNNSSTEKENLLSIKLDSLSNQINELQEQIVNKKNTNSTVQTKKGAASTPTTSIKKDSAIIEQTGPNKPLTPIKIQPRTQPQVSPQPKKEKITQPATQENSVSTFYYYKSSPYKVSVEITRWLNGRRKIIFFDPFGNTTYTCEDARMSYTITTQIKKFHDNGAAALIEVHSNPGASMYWYESHITFGINNEPEWKTDVQKPEMSTEQNMNNKSYWNPKIKHWVKQEVVREQPFPK